MNGLDINTPKGQISKEQENEVIFLLNKKYPHLWYCETPKTKAADIDAIIIDSNNKSIKSVVETKCRNMSFEQFAGQYKFEWLVTFEKIKKGINIASGMFVPFVGILYLVPSKTILIQSIWSPENGYETGMRIEKTKTQATINGGSAIRDNAYIDMKLATIIND